MKITDQQLKGYISENLGIFYAKRLEALSKLKLDDLLKRKNPYLFRSKDVQEVSSLISAQLDAHLSSQEEGLFGNFLEGLAVFVAGVVHNGKKSGIEGIDLEFDKGDTRYIVSIKSGPNWGNSSQVKQLESNFRKASKTIRHGHPSQTVKAVNGCCYGRESKPDKGTYHKLCGQQFWQLISDEEDFYLRIIQPLGRQARKHNEKFAEGYAAVLDKLVGEFSKRFATPSGKIAWKKLVAFNSKK